MLASRSTRLGRQPDHLPSRETGIKVLVTPEPYFITAMAMSASAAGRMRSYRSRRRGGLHFVQILLNPQQIDALVRMRLLKAECRQDPVALHSAMEGFLDWALEDRRLAGAIAEALGPIGG